MNVECDLSTEACPSDRQADGWSCQCLCVSLIGQSNTPLCRPHTHTHTHTHTGMNLHRYEHTLRCLQKGGNSRTDSGEEISNLEREISVRRDGERRSVCGGVFFLLSLFLSWPPAMIVRQTQWFCFMLIKRRMTEMCTDTKPTHTHQLQALLKSPKLCRLLKHEGCSIEKTQYNMLKDSGGKTPTVVT